MTATLALIALRWDIAKRLLLPYYNHLLLSFSTNNKGKVETQIQQYRLAFGLSAESGERQVSTLLYCMGEGAEDILEMTAISEDDRKRYDTVIGMLDTHFKVRKNLIFERARFNNKKQ